MQLPCSPAPRQSQGGQTRSLAPTRRLRYNTKVDKGGQTVSATKFAEITGVSRERLRTWERRFDFPRPQRVARGPRRYPLADAPRVVAVRRAAEQGVPLPRAIADAIVMPMPSVSPALLANVVGAAPVPIVLVTGPEPMRVAYSNAPLHAVGEDAVVGQELDGLPWFIGSDLERTLRTLFSGTVTMLECSHPAWIGGDLPERSVAYRLPVGPGDPPAVALLGVDRAEERRARHELQELQRELARIRGREERQQRWIALASALAERFQREADDTLLPTVATTLVRGLGAVDAGIAVYLSGELAMSGSSRGVLGRGRVTVTGYDDLAGLLHAGVAGWLMPSTGAAFGVPPGLHSLAVPIVVVGETLGLLLIVFDELGELDEGARRLLSVASAGLGFTLLRDRLVASGKERAATP
jgi:hypothetical protein